MCSRFWNTDKPTRGRVLTLQTSRLSTVGSSVVSGRDRRGGVKNRSSGFQRDAAGGRVSLLGLFKGRVDDL